MTLRAGLIPAAPLRALVHDRRIGPSDVASKMRGRSRRSLIAWRRWFDRLEQADAIEYRIADEVCVAMKVHLSRVDTLYWQPELPFTYQPDYGEQVQRVQTFGRRNRTRQRPPDPLDSPSGLAIFPGLLGTGSFLPIKEAI
jgi:hypothetical protein